MMPYSYKTRGGFYGDVRVSIPHVSRWPCLTDLDHSNCRYTEAVFDANFTESIYQLAASIYMFMWRLQHLET